jgi:hypothetical protein
MKITRLYKWTIVLAIGLVFPTASAIAQKKVPPPEL